MGLLLSTNPAPVSQLQKIHSRGVPGSCCQSLSLMWFRAAKGMTSGHRQEVHAQKQYFPKQQGQCRQTLHAFGLVLAPGKNAFYLEHLQKNSALFSALELHKTSEHCWMFLFKHISLFQPPVTILPGDTLPCKNIRSAMLSHTIGPSSPLKDLPFAFHWMVSYPFSSGYEMQQNLLFSY